MTLHAPLGLGYTAKRRAHVLAARLAGLTIRETADELGVSEQVIANDIHLLRLSGHNLPRRGDRGRRHDPEVTTRIRTATQFRQIGWSTRQIAEHLRLTPRTISLYLRYPVGRRTA